MNIYSVSSGRGRAHSLSWYAAYNENEARAFWLAGHPHRTQSEIRTVKILRPANANDTITKTGPIVFAGFGITGPAKTLVLEKENLNTN